ncbi:hypothetical protein [Streptomyces sp. NPDC096068]
MECERGGDGAAVLGHCSTARQYVSRALIACPRAEGDSCPYGTA